MISFEKKEDDGASAFRMGLKNSNFVIEKLDSTPLFEIHSNTGNINLYNNLAVNKELRIGAGGSLKINNIA